MQHSAVLSTFLLSRLIFSKCQKLNFLTGHRTFRIIPTSVLIFSLSLDERKDFLEAKIRNDKQCQNRFFVCPDNYMCYHSCLVDRRHREWQLFLFSTTYCFSIMHFLFSLGKQAIHWEIGDSEFLTFHCSCLYLLSSSLFVDWSILKLCLYMWCRTGNHSSV